MLERVSVPQMKTWPTVWVCDLPVSVAGITESARAMVDYCRGEDRRSATQPLYLTSVNGQVLSMCARDEAIRRQFAAADIIHCDGQPLVLLSRIMSEQPLPERVATTDLFPAVASMAAQQRLTFYMLGATLETNRKAVALTREAYPGLDIVGASHGYLSNEDEQAAVANIARLKPDILWVALGAPREQDFVLRHRQALRGVGIIKTSGGLFDFLAKEKARAPRWMQAAGFEWLFRLMLEPKRLFWRYLVTNPHALFVMITSLRADRTAGGKA